MSGALPSRKRERGLRAKERREWGSRRDQVGAMLMLHPQDLYFVFEDSHTSEDGLRRNWKPMLVSLLSTFRSKKMEGRLANGLLPSQTSLGEFNAFRVCIREAKTVSSLLVPGCLIVIISFNKWIFLKGRINTISTKFYLRWI